MLDRLPEGVVELDERGLIRAVLGGFQDRLEDLRSFADKFELFFSPIGLPESGNNVVLVDLQSAQGNIYTRSLSIKHDTPALVADLPAWAATELNVDISELRNVRFGQDLLRFVDANVLEYLAVTVGAVLYKTAIGEVSPLATQQQLLATHFPRLKIKGTAASFDALGRLLGFDDVRMTPLWGRVTARRPNDPGSPLNDSDYVERTEYAPQQTISPFYDPHLMDDGPFYSWVGTVSAGTSDSNFYTSVVNGFNPFFKVVLVDTAITHPSSGSYALAGGGPHTKAYVEPGNGMRFEALAEGPSFNGLAVKVFDTASGTLKGLQVDDRLSAVKYRTSLFDLGITMEFSRAEKFFGTLVAKPNKDVAASQGVVSFGVSVPAVSPYRPFRAGTVSYSNTVSDYVTVTGSNVVSFQQRVEASVTDQQHDFDALAAAAFQVSQAIEEVRPATRLPRRTAGGYLIRDTVGYAPNRERSVMFTVSSGSFSALFHQEAGGFPSEPYVASVAFVSPTDVSFFSGESTPTDQSSSYYKFVGKGGTISGKYTYSGSGSNTYSFAANGTFTTSGTVYAYWKPTSSEVVRHEPLCDSGTLIIAAVGDYGQINTPNPTPWFDVLEMIKSWNPKAVLLLGDNTYSDGDPNGFARANDTMKAWADAYGVKLYPVIGNHDIEASSDLSAYISYFKPPGNGRFYSVRIGPMEFFSYNAGLDSTISQFDHGRENPSLGTLEPDGISAGSEQGRWLRDGLMRSTATFKVVGQHFPPWVSEANTTAMWPGYEQLRLPYKQWGADILLNGHMHTYERLQVDGLPVMVIGNGGKDVRVYDNVHNSPYSLLRFPVAPSVGDFGASRIVITATTMRFEHWTRGGVLVDVFTLTKDGDKCLYTARPEDDTVGELNDEVADEYPWRRDVVGAGELVEVDYRAPITADMQTVGLDNETRVLDHTGAEYSVYGIKASDGSLRLVVNKRNLADQVPGQLPIALKGDFKDQASLTPNELEWFVGPEAHEGLHDDVSFPDGAP